MSLLAEQGIRITTATLADLPEIYAIECECFDSAERDSLEQIERRIRTAGEYFWLLRTAEGKLAGFLNGIGTQEEDFTEEIFTAPHDSAGECFAFISLDIKPEYRGRGYTSPLIAGAIAATRGHFRRGNCITKPNMLKYYATFGFVDEGISACTHGGVQWHQMGIDLR